MPENNDVKRKYLTKKDKMEFAKYRHGVITLIIALLAFVVAFWQGYETRKYYRLSAKPLLTIRSYKNDPKLNITGVALTNKGLGPAIIIEFAIILPDRTVVIDGDDDIGIIFQSTGWDAMGWHNKIPYSYYTMNDVIIPKEESLLFYVEEETSAINGNDKTHKNEFILKRSKFWESLKTFKIRIKYKTLYDDVETKILELNKFLLDS